MSGVSSVRPSSLGDVVWALAIAHDVARARPGMPGRLGRRGTVRRRFHAMCADVRRIGPGRAAPLAPAPLAPATWREMRGVREGAAARASTTPSSISRSRSGARVIARLARGTRHGLDRASIREPIATLVRPGASRRVAGTSTSPRAPAASPAPRSGTRVSGSPRWRWHVPPPPACAPQRPVRRRLRTRRRREDKRWPDGALARAHRRASRAAGLAVLVPHGNDAEERAAGALAAGMAHAIVPPRHAVGRVWRPCSLVRDAVVGVDTGLTHLAAALGAPTLALFTTTDARARGRRDRRPHHARDLGGNGGRAFARRRTRGARRAHASARRDADARALHRSRGTSWRRSRRCACGGAGARNPATASAIGERFGRYGDARAATAMSSGSTRCRSARRAPPRRWSSACARARPGATIVVTSMTRDRARDRRDRLLARPRRAGVAALRPAVARCGASSRTSVRRSAC